MRVTGSVRKDDREEKKRKKQQERGTDEAKEGGQEKMITREKLVDTLTD